MKILQIIEHAFRAIGEEQDDTILWLSNSMRSIGADICILLSGNAVFYSMPKSPAPALVFGDWTQTHPADISNDVQQLLASGVEVTVLEEDLEERGLAEKQCLKGIQRIGRNELATLYDSVDQVWQW